MAVRFQSMFSRFSTTFVVNEVAQTSASWLSGGLSPLQAAASLGKSAAWAELAAGHIGLRFSMGVHLLHHEVAAGGLEQ